MNNLPKLGSTIDLAVIRKDGTVEDYGTRHNVMGDFIFNPAMSTPTPKALRIYIPTNEPSSFDDVRFTLHDNGYGTRELVGTYALSSGPTIVRISGEAFTTGDYVGGLYKFPSGFTTYKTAHVNGNVIMVNVSGSWVTTSNLSTYKTANNGYGYNIFDGPEFGFCLAYKASSYYISLSNTANFGKSVSALFAAVTSDHTATRIGYQMSFFTGTPSGYIDLYPPLALSAGDSLLIKNFTYNLTYNIDAPRIFTTSPIEGITGSGRMQRTIPYDRDETEGVITKIYLVSDANKIPLPTSLSSYKLSAGHLPATAKYTITPTTNNKTCSLANNATALLSGNGTFVSDGVTPIKQIIYGDTQWISGIIEYDSTFTPAAGTRRLAITSSLQMIVET